MYSFLKKVFTVAVILLIIPTVSAQGKGKGKKDKDQYVVPYLAGVGGAVSCTVTAASASQANVATALSGRTNGDTVCIPAGSATWTSGVTIPAGVSVMGAGTPATSPITDGPSATCQQTVITAAPAALTTLFAQTPTYGNATSRISCMQITYSSGPTVAITAQGTCTSSGCPSIRWDNLTFIGWAGHADTGTNSYGVNAASDVFGVIDHNKLVGDNTNYLQFVEVGLPHYRGVGEYGDNDWVQGDTYGTAEALFMENNYIDSATLTENETIAVYTGGGRVVGRFNTFVNMGHYDFIMGWHGTESNGRPRGVKHAEIYQNTLTCLAGETCEPLLAARSGNGYVWGNNYSFSGANLSTLAIYEAYRRLQNIGGWGACDGAGTWDTNDAGSPFYDTNTAGTSVTVTGSNPYTFTFSPSPGWSASQWVSVGSPYSIHDVTIDNGSEITASTSNTITVSAWTAISYASGDRIQIRRATACIDQVGYTGGTAFSGNPASPASSSAQVRGPSYTWMNTLTAASIFGDAGDIFPSSSRFQVNREFYRENRNQAAQSSSTSPFDGSTTIGMGHGLVSNRPTTCTAGAGSTKGVGYWATDEGSWNTSGRGTNGRLYLCTATNTWTLSYTPYLYPHPLVQ